MSSSWAFPKALDLESLFAPIQVKDRIPNGILEILDDCKEDQKWAIACSGGADSTFLTFLLFYKFPILRDRLVLCHFNHRLRGQDSESDQKFVNDIGNHLGIPLTSEIQNSYIKKDEASLRDKRMEFFKDVATKKTLSHIFLGHHADDVAETFLWRLPRSSTVSGLNAPKPVSIHDNLILIRPLLNFSRMEIKDFLIKSKIPWREDQSNKDGKQLRNRIRSYVVPPWKDSFERDFHQGISKTRELLEQDADALDYYANKAYRDCKNGKLIKIDCFNTHPIAIRRRILRLWLTESLPFGFSFDGNENEILKQIKIGKISTTDLPKNLRVAIKDGLLSVGSSIYQTSRIPITSLPLGNSIFFPNGKRLKALPLSANCQNVKNAVAKKVSESKEAYISAQRIKLLVRSRREGDKLHILGSDGSSKVSKLMIDRKWTRQRKEETPLIVNTLGEILWIPGFPPSEKYKIIASTDKVIHLTYE